MNSAWLSSRVRFAINKNNICRYQTISLLKTWFLFLVCKKGQDENKSEVATKSVICVIEKLKKFSLKNISQIAHHTFATQCFVTGHLNHKTVNRTCTHIIPTMGTLAEKHSNYCDYFFRFSGFHNLSGKVFLISFKFS